MVTFTGVSKSCLFPIDVDCSPYWPTEEEPPITSIVFPFPACSPPASQAGVSLNRSGLLRSPYKAWDAVAKARGIEAASSKEIVDGFLLKKNMRKEGR